MKAWGNSVGYAHVQTLPVWKIVLYTVTYIFLLSVIHTIFLYAHIQHFINVTVPGLAQEFPESVQIVLSNRKMSLVGASTTSFTLRGSKTNVPVLFDATRMATDATDLTREANSIALYRDMMVFTGREQEERSVYPDGDVSIDKASVVAWATQMTQLFPWLVCIVFIFLFVSNSISAVFISLFFLCVVRLYTRFSPPMLAYRDAYVVAWYTLIPVLSINTISYIIFGFSSFLITVLSGLLCLHYGLKK